MAIHLIYVLVVSKSDFKSNILQATEILDPQPSVIKNSKSYLAVGDIHGDLDSIHKAVNIQTENTIENIVFIGDFIDRGTKQIESLDRLCKMIIDEPKKVTLLRGNHEDTRVCSRYGFRSVLEKSGFIDLWEIIGVFFSKLPILLIQRSNTMFVHGGIPSYVAGSMFDLEDVKKAPETIGNDNHLTRELLWNDPFEAHYNEMSDIFDTIPDFYDNPRGPGCKTFSLKAVEKTLKHFNLKYLVRAHISLKEGYKWYNDQTLSIFSSASGPYRNTKPAYAECRINESIIIHH